MPNPSDRVMLAKGRQWAAAALEAGVAGAVPPPPPPAHPDWVWAHLARADRVASSLARALGRGGYAVPEALRKVALRDEQQRLLLVGGAMEVARVAAGAGVRAVFLKGAAELGDPEADVTGDLDLLVSLAELPVLAAALEGAGWVSDVPVAPGEMHAVYFRRPGQPVSIDLHVIGHGWDAAFLAECLAQVEPMAGVPAGWVPAPHHRAWHLLLHGVLQHPERRGALRDLRRLRRLAARMAPAGHAWLASRMAGHRQGARMALVWEAARVSLDALVVTECGPASALVRESLMRHPLPVGRFGVRRQQLLFTMVGPAGGWRELLRTQLVPYRHPGMEGHLPWRVALRWYAKVPARYALTVLLAVLLLPRWWRVRTR